MLANEICAAEAQRRFNPGRCYTHIPMSAQPTVLCIDDDEGNLTMRKWLFAAEGFQVLTAVDGASGIDLFKTKPVDAVVVDYNMPIMNGDVVAQQLKNLRPELPIIMLSGEMVPEDAKRHVDAFVTKGGSPAALLATASALLHLRSHSHPEFDGKYVAFVVQHRCYLDVTDGVCELLGYSRHELLTMTIDDVTAPIMRSKTTQLFQEYLSDGRQQGEYVLRDRDGQDIPIGYLARVFADGCMVARWTPKKSSVRSLRSGSQRTKRKPR